MKMSQMNAVPCPTSCSGANHRAPTTAPDSATMVRNSWPGVSMPSGTMRENRAAARSKAPSSGHSRTRTMSAAWRRVEASRQASQDSGSIGTRLTMGWLLPVRDQDVGQIRGSLEHREVAAFDLDRLDAQDVPGGPSTRL